MEKNKINNFKLSPLVDPKYVRTSLASYIQNGVAKTWEVVQAHDSVSILIYHTQKEAFVLVKQFRPAVYVKNNNGVTVELCAGMVDKPLSLENIAREEIEEECGYRVDTKGLEEITFFYTSVGFAGSRQTLYYVEVDQTMQVSEGGGIDNEHIEVVYLPVKEAKEMMFDGSVTKPPGLLFAFMWWFERKQDER